jgi:hypothetical protein
MRLELIASIVLIGILGRVLSCPNDKYCLKCGDGVGGVKICEYCQDSFFNTETGLCDPNIGPKIDNCIQYKKDNDRIDCEKCKWGFHADSVSGTCIKFGVPGCALYHKAVCIGCLDGVLLNLLLQKCDPNIKNSIPFCNVSLNIAKELCLECDEGYTLSFLDQRCYKGIENCASFPIGTVSKCDTCRLGYYIAQDGSCKPIPKDNNDEKVPDDADVQKLRDNNFINV